jgi:hypothetical protein
MIPEYPGQEGAGMALADVVDSYYNDAFESAFAFGMSIVEREKERGTTHIQGILRSLYVRQGNDLTGRGLFADTDIEASIAAYELVLAIYDGRLPASLDTTPLVS